MHDQYGLNKMILKSGITQSVDQQAAGLIMWVPCCLIYVTGAMYLLLHWFKQKEETVAYSNKI
jgi:cytochrome c oxidase assembly factor CtaG